MEDKQVAVKRITMGDIRKNIERCRKERHFALVVLSLLLLLTLADAWLIGSDIGTTIPMVGLMLINLVCMVWLIRIIITTVEDECIDKSILAMQYMTMEKTEDGYQLRFDYDAALLAEEEEDSDGA